ncbi:11791_t:CDS:2, partial [Scutellospora calospora]
KIAIYSSSAQNIPFSDLQSNNSNEFVKSSFFTTTQQWFQGNSHVQDWSEQEPKGADEYTLNVGKAIRTIRSDLSTFFERGLTDTSIYSQDILLSDPYHTGLHVRGKHVYFGIANLLRWSLIWYFDDLTLEIVKIHVADNNMEDKNGTGRDILFKDTNCDTHFKDSNDKLNRMQHKDRDKNLTRVHTVPLLSFSTSAIQSSNRNIRLYIRWELEGTPRSSYIASMLSSRSTQIPRSSFSGIFVYKFGSKNGLVTEHHVNHIVPAPSRKAVLYQGFGGLGGLMWRLRSGLRQKNELGVGLGIVGAKTQINVKSSKDKHEHSSITDI